MLYIFYNHFINYPTPSLLTYFWSFGFIAAMLFGVQLISGIFLAMFYIGDISLAFNSVEHIMRDLVNGSLLRYIHANGASFFFICVYCHILRGLFFSSFKYSQRYIWMSGIIIFILMMGIAFMGYVLPWGQMSYWGATVITNMISAIPSVGYSIVLWIWGGFSVAGPTLTRFFCFHFLFPFLLLAFVLLHIVFLHQVGSSSVFYRSVKDNGDLATSYNLLSLSPHFIVKDLVSLVFFFFIYLFVVFFAPDLMGHPDNYIEANALVTPEHIVPEWYFFILFLCLFTFLYFEV